MGHTVDLLRRIAHSMHHIDNYLVTQPEWKRCNQLLFAHAEGKVDERRLRKAFLAAPLRSANYGQNFGTVYTAAYKPLSETMSYHWPEEKAWRHSFADFRVSEKTVSLVQQASLATVYGDIVEQTDADLSLPASVRQQLLQSLVYLPVSVVGQPKALEKLKQNLMEEKFFCWKDYARQAAEIWRYPLPAKLG